MFVPVMKLDRRGVPISTIADGLGRWNPALFEGCTMLLSFLGVYYNSRSAL